MSSEFRADLHCHTLCSDGSDLPEELLKIAAQIGLKGLSITDHDTVDAYTPSLFLEAEKLGIHLLTGVELSSELNGTAVHVLGYGFDIKSESLKAFLSEIQLRRTGRNREILRNLRDHGISVTEEELLAFALEHNAKRSIGRPHIAQLLVQKNYVRTIPEAFERFLKEGALCYAQGFKFTPLDAIQQIQKAGGKAVLAHPHFIKKGSFLRKLLDFPFDGIECYYSLLHKSIEAPWLKLAEERKLIATGGSDYHGAIKPQIPLGCSWVGEHTFNKLRGTSHPN